MTTKRRYDASGRRAAAQERRLRIADTAAAMFAERGWAGTTIAGVAAGAGVSPELVATAFGGKPGLFMAAFQRASFGSESDLSQELGALRLDLEPELEVRLDRFVDFACRVLVPMAPLVQVLALGADQDAELEKLLRAAQRRHAETTQELVRLLAPGPVGQDAVDEVYVLTRAEAYIALVHHRGWTLERYAAWLRRSVAAAVGLQTSR